MSETIHARPRISSEINESNTVSLENGILSLSASSAAFSAVIFSGYREEPAAMPSINALEAYPSGTAGNISD